jgi:hypothetical protein
MQTCRLGSISSTRNKYEAMLYICTPAVRGRPPALRQLPARSGQRLTLLDFVHTPMPKTLPITKHQCPQPYLLPNTNAHNLAYDQTPMPTNLPITKHHCSQCGYEYQCSQYSPRTYINSVDSRRPCAARRAPGLLRCTVYILQTEPAPLRKATYG